MSLFRKRDNSPRPLAPVDYPSDVFVSTESGVYFIKGGYRFRLFSDRALQSWRANILRGSDAALGNHKEGPALGFRNGTLIRSFADSKYYIISENKRRHIVSPDAFVRYGLNAMDALLVSRDEINIHEEGEVLS